MKSVVLLISIALAMVLFQGIGCFAFARLADDRARFGRETVLEIRGMAAGRPDIFSEWDIDTMNLLLDEIAYTEQTARTFQLAGLGSVVAALSLIASLVSLRKHAPPSQDPKAAATSSADVG